MFDDDKYLLESFLQKSKLINQILSEIVFFFQNLHTQIKFYTLRTWIYLDTQS
jgi:hypothetical protein